MLDRPSPVAGRGSRPCYQARCSFRQMPSRQERRKGERDAAKRAPAQARATGAAGAAVAAAALANLNMNVKPVGDWTTQAANSNLFRALGPEMVKRRAAEGDMEAQFSLGYRLMAEAEGSAEAPLGTAATSPKSDVGLTPRTAQFPVARTTALTRRCGHLMIERCICGCQPCAQEGMALMEKAAGQGHAYAMSELACVHKIRNEHERAVEWYTKGAEAGLPVARFNLGVCLDHGEGVAAPDHLAVAGWYRRAADAGDGDAAQDLSRPRQGGSLRQKHSTDFHLLLARVYEHSNSR